MIVPSQKPIFDENKKITLELRARVDFPFNKLEKLLVSLNRYNMLEAEIMALLWACIIADFKEEIKVNNNNVKRFITEKNIKKEGNIEILVSLIKALINYKRLKLI